MCTSEAADPGGDVSPDIVVKPDCAHWPALLDRRPRGDLFGRPLEEWRRISRRELGLPDDGPIIATGHQTLLWHPGILAKYLVVDAFARTHRIATANLVVDQHAEGFGDFEIPLRRQDGSWSARRIELCRPRPRKDVPMGRHEAFTPPRPPPAETITSIPSVGEGVLRIFDAVYAHRNAPNAAIQMANALSHLLSYRDWVRPMPSVTSTALIGTSLARALMAEMARDPGRGAECYNRAVADVPESRITPLMIRDDYVELPLWRIRPPPDSRRMHAYDNDVAEAVTGAERQSRIQNPKSKIDLLPRALFMTALVRLCMCDLFIHGTGGALYDRAMEIWIKRWLGIEVGSIAVATANLRLPLGIDPSGVQDVQSATAKARRLWHDPDSSGNDARPSQSKRTMLDQIGVAAFRSSERKGAFLAMHEQLKHARQARPQVDAARQGAELARRAAADLAVAARRDWAFSLYPDRMIDGLARQAASAVTAGGGARQPFVSGSSA